MSAVNIGHWHLSVTTPEPGASQSTDTGPISPNTDQVPGRVGTRKPMFKTLVLSDLEEVTRKKWASKPGVPLWADALPGGQQGGHRLEHVRICFLWRNELMLKSLKKGERFLNSELNRCPTISELMFSIITTILDQKLMKKKNKPNLRGASTLHSTAPMLHKTVPSGLEPSSALQGAAPLAPGH